MIRAAKRHKITGKNRGSKIISSRNGVVTIEVPVRKNAYKKDDEVIVLVSRDAKSYFSDKTRKVSEIIAQGPIKSVEDGMITIDTSKSHIVSKRAQSNAVSKNSPVIIRSIGR